MICIKIYPKHFYLLLIVIIFCITLMYVISDKCDQVRVFDATTKEYLTNIDISVQPSKIVEQIGGPGTNGGALYIFRPKIPFPTIVEVSAEGYVGKKVCIFMYKGSMTKIYLSKENKSH